MVERASKKKSVVAYSTLLANFAVTIALKKGGGSGN